MIGSARDQRDCTGPASRGRSSGSICGSASRRNAQWPCPSGASLHAVAIRKASPRPSSFRLWPGCGSSFSAFSSPPSTYRLRMHSSVGRLTPIAVMICGSLTRRTTPPPYSGKKPATSSKLSPPCSTIPPFYHPDLPQNNSSTIRNSARSYWYY